MNFPSCDNEADLKEANAEKYRNLFKIDITDENSKYLTPFVEAIVGVHADIDGTPGSLVHPDWVVIFDPDESEREPPFRRLIERHTALLKSRGVTVVNRNGTKIFEKFIWCVRVPK